MTITEMTATEYETLFSSGHVYNSVSFAMLNAAKAEAVRYLAVGDHKHRFGIILGERGGRLMSPFSAPFGGFDMRGVQALNNMDEAVRQLADYASRSGKKLSVTLPPLIYGESQISKWVSAFLRNGFRPTVDLNYYFPLSHFSDYTEHIDRSARKNLNRSLKESFVFRKINSEDKEAVRRAYEVIRCNREEHGYPLRMSFEQVWDTVQNVVTADFFLLGHEGEDVAAAQVFHVAPGIAQVIYWGDKRKYSELRPMNCLTYNVFRHYSDAGLRILDIGPSTEDGVPNYGLCEFKENIGCGISLKYRFEI